MSGHVSAGEQPSPASKTGLFAWYHRAPLYVRILVALAVGIVVGWLMGPRAAAFRPFSDIVLQLLKLMATPLIFIAVLNALLAAKVNGRTAARLLYLLLSNTVVAILVGLFVANTLRPGRFAHFAHQSATIVRRAFDPGRDLLEKIPSNLVDGFQKNEIISIIIIAVAFGIALRVVRRQMESEGREDYRVVVLMSVTASVGAAGIPEAGLVTMMAVFSAVRLPVEFIPFLLPLDWFLDRCRTAINVMGDMSVTCLLDGKRPEAKAATAPAAVAAEAAV
jgi:Na+/H+-dicarboxylate symporter